MNVKKLQRRLFILLLPFSLLYGLIMKMRRRLYAGEFLKRYKPDVPTISLGNISWGGTGKTPLASALLAWAEGAGLKAVVLTRGYKASPPTLPFLVNNQSHAHEVGDEPLMLARQHKKAFVLVDPKRARSAAFAEKELAPDIIFLDDGFQHMGIARNIDIVLLTQEDIEEGWGKVIPAGTWREGAQALDDATLFLLRFKSEEEYFSPAGQMLLELARNKLPPKPLFAFCLNCSGLKRPNLQHENKSYDGPQGDGPQGDEPQRGMPDGSSTVPFKNMVDNLGGQKYNLCAGIGKPEAALETAKKLLGYGPQKFYPLPDHHFFNDTELAQMLEGAENLICTEKDAVKIEELKQHEELTGKVWVLVMRAVFLPQQNGTTFLHWWEEEFLKISKDKTK